MAIHARAHLGEEIEVLGGARNQLLARLRNRQAGIARFQLGQHRHVLVDQLAQPAHQAGAFLRGRASPLGEGVGRGRDGRIDFGLAAGGHFFDSLARGRVEGSEAVRAVDLPAVDPVLDAHAQLLGLGLRRNGQRKNN
ncbi:hypothetical protein D9M68_804280 [compost metagenome]